MTEKAAISVEDDLLVAEYVLGVLPHAERVALAQRMAADGALRDRMSFWEGHLAPLDALTVPVPPPARVLGAVERRLFPVEHRGQGLLQSLAFWRSLAVALFCALLIGGTMSGMRLWRSPVPPGASYVAELAGTGGSVRLVALVDPGTGRVKLNRLAGAPAAGRDFQLWLVDGNSPPISLGVLPQEALATLQLGPDLTGKFGPKSVLAVSDEPRGGSPTGLPTGAVLATGALSAI